MGGRRKGENNETSVTRTRSETRRVLLLLLLNRLFAYRRVIRPSLSTFRSVRRPLHVNNYAHAVYTVRRRFLFACDEYASRSLAPCGKSPPIAPGRVANRSDYYYYYYNKVPYYVRSYIDRVLSSSSTVHVRIK